MTGLVVAVKVIFAIVQVSSVLAAAILGMGAVMFCTTVCVAVVVQPLAVVVTVTVYIPGNVAVAVAPDVVAALPLHA